MERKQGRFKAATGHGQTMILPPSVYCFVKKIPYNLMGLLKWMSPGRAQFVPRIKRPWTTRHTESLRKWSRTIGTLASSQFDWLLSVPFVDCCAYCKKWKRRLRENVSFTYELIEAEHTLRFEYPIIPKVIVKGWVHTKMAALSIFK
jgi:hypothetical protein